MKKSIRGRITRRNPGLLRRLLVAFCCFLPAGSVLAETGDFQPASFKSDSESLESRIHFPKSAPMERTTLLCHTLVGQLGRMGPISCYSTRDNAGYRYSEAVIRAGKSLMLSPARINGVPQQVEMQFRVEFNPAAAKGTIQVYPNQGLYNEKLGNNYFTSQRVAQDNELNSFCSGTHDFITETDIDAGGRASNRRIVSGGDNKKCTDYYIGRAKLERFIPAMKDGTPIDSVRVERWYSRDKVRW